MEQVVTEVDFDFWRRLTVEHLIGESQGGYLREIKKTLAERFPTMSQIDLEVLSGRTDETDTISACSFCNSTTSRDHAAISMTEAIAGAPGGPAEDIYEHVTKDLAQILESKRADVAWKPSTVRAQFDKAVAPRLAASRSATGEDV
jgi:hypothetical protein